jgi:hypothetical protein
MAVQATSVVIQTRPDRISAGGAMAHYGALVTRRSMVMGHLAVPSLSQPCWTPPTAVSHTSMFRYGPAA